MITKENMKTLIAKIFLDIIQYTIFVIVLIIDNLFDSVIVGDKDSLLYIGNLLVILQLIFMFGHFFIQIYQKFVQIKNLITKNEDIDKKYTENNEKI